MPWIRGVDQDLLMLWASTQMLMSLCFAHHSWHWHWVGEELPRQWCDAVACWCPRDAGGLGEAEATSRNGQQEPGAAAGGLCNALHYSHGTSPRCSNTLSPALSACPTTHNPRLVWCTWESWLSKEQDSIQPSRNAFREIFSWPKCLKSFVTTDDLSAFLYQPPPATASISSETHLASCSPNRHFVSLTNSNELLALCDRWWKHCAKGKEGENSHWKILYVFVKIFHPCTYLSFQCVKHIESWS